MIEPGKFNQLIAEIGALGYTKDLAAHFAALIGDTPCFDEQGNVIVLDAGREIARLAGLRFFDLIIDGDADLPDYAALAKLPREEANRLIETDQVPMVTAAELARRDAQALVDVYEARFGNYGEIALPAFMDEARFLELLAAAIQRGRPLTQGEITKVFPDAPWDY